MADVQISPASGSELAELAAVMVEAFSGEAIHRYVLDFGREGTKHALLRPFIVEVESIVAAGDIVLAARLDGRIVGAATLSSGRGRPLRRSIAEGLRWLVAVVPLLPAVRWSRVIAVHRVARMSRRLVGPYFVLPALAVHPAFQGRGIGPLLLDAIHEHVERDGQALGVYLYTGERRSQRMYEKAGYRTVEARRAGSLTIYHLFRTNGGWSAPPGDDEGSRPETG